MGPRRSPGAAPRRARTGRKARGRIPRLATAARQPWERSRQTLYRMWAAAARGVARNRPVALGMQSRASANSRDCAAGSERRPLAGIARERERCTDGAWLCAHLPTLLHARQAKQEGDSSSDSAWSAARCCPRPSELPLPGIPEAVDRQCRDLHESVSSEPGNHATRPCWPRFGLAGRRAAASERQEGLAPSVRVSRSRAMPARGRRSEPLRLWGRGGWAVSRPGRAAMPAGGRRSEPVGGRRACRSGDRRSLSSWWGGCGTSRTRR